MKHKDAMFRYIDTAGLLLNSKKGRVHFFWEKLDFIGTKKIISKPG